MNRLIGGIAAALLLHGAALACTGAGSSSNPLQSLSIGNTSFSVSDRGEQPQVVTLGTLKNASANCISGIIIEVTYFDSKHQLIDTITQQLYGKVVPPGREVAFRMLDVAARTPSLYASQTARVISAENLAANGRRAKPSRTSPSLLLEAVVQWLPFVILIGVWFYFMRRINRKGSPQDRSLALVAQQVELLGEQNALLARLTNAVEAKAGRQD